MAYVHRGCGGTVTNKVCSKCKKKWNRIAWLMGKDLDLKSVDRFNANQYRKRIRQGRDILR